MNNNYLPVISVIIPCFNGEHRLPILLDSIKMQTYQQDKIEIIVVDDDSIDDTIKIAKKYGCIVVRNGEHYCERGKSIGVEASNGEYIFLIDDDNCLPHKSWLSELVRAVTNEDCVGGQAYKFHYDRKDLLINRYASLFGINDPTVFYLKRMDKLMFTENTWTLLGKVILNPYD
ncbi:glycosyltransferase family 2 protein [Treponema sp. R80B11-R83G3]